MTTSLGDTRLAHQDSWFLLLTLGSWGWGLQGGKFKGVSSLPPPPLMDPPLGFHWSFPPHVERRGGGEAPTQPRIFAPVFCRSRSRKGSQTLRGAPPPAAWLPPRRPWMVRLAPPHWAEGGGVPRAHVVDPPSAEGETGGPLPGVGLEKCLSLSSSLLAAGWRRA